MAGDDLPGDIPGKRDDRVLYLDVLLFDDRDSINRLYPSKVRLSPQKKIVAGSFEVILKRQVSEVECQCAVVEELTVDDISAAE